MFNRHSGGTASSNPLDPSPERVAPRRQALLELAMRCVRRPGSLGFSVQRRERNDCSQSQKPLSRSIAALLELAPAAAWARIVTSGSQRPRTVKGFAQCGTLFHPPPLPISIERHYTRRKQIREFVVLGARLFCRIDLVTPLVGTQFHQRDEERAIGLVA